jgi:hypothetical protein
MTQFTIHAAVYPARNASADAAASFHSGRQSRRAAASSIPHSPSGSHAAAPSTPGCSICHITKPENANTPAPSAAAMARARPRSHRYAIRNAIQTWRNAKIS